MRDDGCASSARDRSTTLSPRVGRLICLFPIGFLYFCFGCASEDPGPPDPAGPARTLVPVALSKPTVAGILSEIQSALDDSVFVEVATSPPRLVDLANEVTVEGIRSDTDDAGFMMARLDPRVFDRTPILVTAADLEFYVLTAVSVPRPPDTRFPAVPAAAFVDSKGFLYSGSPTPDEALRTKVGEFLDEVRALGLPMDAIREAYDNSLFYGESDFLCELPPTTDDGATLTWGQSPFLRIGRFNDWIIFWWDGRSHVVLTEENANQLRAGDFFRSNGEPTNGASTGLHELTHVFMASLDCGLDDDGDIMVGTLERALGGRIGMERQRAATGSPSYATTASYSTDIADVMGRDGHACLTLLGLVYVREFEVEAPATIQIGAESQVVVTLRGPSGILAGLDVALSVGETQVVAQTDAQGRVRVAFTAPGVVGEDINVRIRAAGANYDRTIPVIDSSVQGACCLPDLLCAVIPPAECSSSGGNYQGSGTVCTPGRCTGLGACCADDGRCLLRTREQCDFLDYGFLGAGVPCDLDPCAPLLGACCVGIACSLLTLEDCQTAGGERFIPLGACDPNPCVVRGGCCDAAGACTMTTREECASLDHFYAGDTIPCAPNPCPQPGACCLTSGGCVVVPVYDCNATFLGSGTSCEPNPCVDPGMGACCALSSCVVQTEAGCQSSGFAYYLGDGSVCEPEPCFGACCELSGYCLIRRSRDCDASGGDFYGFDTTCPPEFCAEPRGACCYPDGSCAVLTSLECIQNEEAVFHPAVSCDNTICPE